MCLRGGWGAALFCCEVWRALRCGCYEIGLLSIARPLSTPAREVAVKR